MKIIWAIPIFDNPETGGQKVFKRLYELFESKGVNIVKTYWDNKEEKSILNKIFINFRNLKILIGQDKKAPIIQVLYHRSEYLLANILLHFLLKRKIILFVDQIYKIDNILLIKKWVRFLVNNFLFFWSTSLIVVNSKYTGDWICRFGNFKNKLFLMYPVINLRTKNLRVMKESNISPVNILCVSNIKKNKGQIYLLKAMRYIQKDFKITFVGMVHEKEYMKKLRIYVIENGISDKVHFAGFLSGSQLVEEYQKADIFVLPSLKEGFGMVIYEAMSYGLPFITCKTCGILEQVNDGQEGFVVPPKDPWALANKLDKLITDSELRIRMGQLGRECAAKLPTVDQVFDEFCQIVTDLSRNR